MAYTLDQIVLRIGEILQFKNYLAEFIPPYPEDEDAAKWVREYAEPNGIVDKAKGIFTDDVQLLRSKDIDEDMDASVAPTDPEPTEPPQPKIRIKGIKPKTGGNMPKKIIIKKDQSKKE